MITLFILKHESTIPLHSLFRGQRHKSLDKRPEKTARPNIMRVMLPILILKWSCRYGHHSHITVSAIVPLNATLRKLIAYTQVKYHPLTLSIIVFVRNNNNKLIIRQYCPGIFARTPTILNNLRERNKIGTYYSSSCFYIGPISANYIDLYCFNQFRFATFSQVLIYNFPFLRYQNGFAYTFQTVF